MTGSPELRSVEQVLSRPEWNKDFFRAILDFADMAVMVINPDYEIVYANRHVSNLFGVPLEVLNGMELPRHKTLPDEELQRVIDHMVRVLEQGISERIENWALRPDGTRLLMLWASTPLRGPNGAIEHLLSVGMDVTEQHTMKNRLESLAHRDALIGLHNRTFFDLRLAEELSRLESGEGPGIALFFIDLDGFKAVNDTYGHDVGDAVLRVVAKRLRAKVRQSDIVCRLGGDEFVVILPNAPSQAIVQDIVTEVVQTLAKPYFLDGHTCNLSASIGIALAPQNGGNPHELVHVADAAMYQAKRAGKNRFVFG